MPMLWWLSAQYPMDIAAMKFSGGPVTLYTSPVDAWLKKSFGYFWRHPQQQPDFHRKSPLSFLITTRMALIAFLLLANVFQEARTSRSS